MQMWHTYNKVIAQPRYEKYLYLFIALYVFRGIFINLLGTVSSVISLNTTPITSGYYLVMWVFLLLSLFYLIPYCARNGRLFLFGFVSALLIICNLLLFPNSSAYIFSSFTSDILGFQTSCLLSALLFVYVGAACSDYDRLLKNLIFVAKIGVALSIIRTLLKLIVLQTHNYDDMNFAYELCTMLCVLGVAYVFKQGKHMLPYLIAGSIMLLIAGTRGAIVAFIIALVIAYLLSGRLTKRTVVIMIMAVILCIAVWVGLIEALAKLLDSVAQKLGIDFRIVDMILNGDIADSSGRSDIQGNVISAIWANPILGNGVGMDQAMFHYYAHNIVLELLFDFGIPVGVAIILWVLTMTVKSVMGDNGSFKVLIIAFFCAAAMKLMFSQTYITSREFFLLIGFLLSVATVKPREKANLQVGIKQFDAQKE